MLSTLNVIEDRTVLIMGKTGAGKTCMIDHLLRAPHFNSKDSPNAVTLDIASVKAVRTKKDGGSYVFTIFDSMGFFDPILDNSVIAQKLTNFIHYELSHLNRVIICIKKARVTGEFIKSIKECLDLFQVDALASLVKICITDLKVSIREEWMKEFFDNLQIKAVIEEYKLSKENFLGVDLFLSDVGFSDDLDNPTCKDTIVLEEMIIASERRFHKSQIIKGMDVDEQGIKSYISKITSWVLGEKKVVNVEPGNGQVAQNSVQATNAVPVPVTNSV